MYWNMSDTFFIFGGRGMVAADVLCAEYGLNDILYTKG
jgi:hypothetical protein